jgi:CubicO group peptidase (beta-lactamase class C family)
MMEKQLSSIAAQLGANYIHLGFYENNAEPQLVKSSGAGTGYGAAPGHPILCSIKLLTATIVNVLAQTHQLDLRNTLGGIVPSIRIGSAAAADDIQITQLLSHSHGLADTLRANPDAATALSRLFHPGKFYSYGSTGYMLLGKIIEAVFKQRFERVLYQVVLEKIACAETQRHFYDSVLGGGGQLICPAAGSGLSLTLEDLLVFCRVFTDGANAIEGLTAARIHDMLQPKVAMPGWSPYIKASCYGFRDFGHGWYGHNGINQNFLTYLRLNPARKSAICLVAKGTKDNIGMLPAMALRVPGVLRERFPELAATIATQPNIDVDKRLPDEHPLFGTYGDCLYQYKVIIKGGRLKLAIAGPDAAQRTIIHECHLYPAEKEIYFLSRPWKKVTCIQLIQDDKSGACYLWNLDQTIPKLDR